MLLSAISAICFAQTAIAPTDVPKNHWAYPAVNRLFGEGLLKGYPKGQHPKRRLDDSIQFSKSSIGSLFTTFRLIGLATGFPHSSIRGANVSEPSRYEYALMVHLIWGNSIGSLASGERTPASRLELLSHLPKIAEAISMLNKDLTRLGADCKQMIADLNNQFKNAPWLFLGDRR